MSNFGELYFGPYGSKLSNRSANSISNFFLKTPPCETTVRLLSLKGGPPSPQHEHGKMCWGEKYRGGGEITNTSNLYFLSCHAEGETSRHNCQPAQQQRS